MPNLIRVQAFLDSRVVSRLLAALIVLSVGGLVLQTLPALPPSARAWLAFVEFSTIIVFSLEYAVRIWAAGVNPKFAGLGGRLRYMLTPMALLDLAAIAPAYSSGLTTDLRFLRLPRLLRLLRLAKLSRYSPALGILGKVLYRKRAELTVVATAAALVLIAGATVMYLLELSSQPEQFSSIPASMWWTVITLTTVGYGDVYPITTGGKIVASLIATLGIGLFALPTAILGSAFLEELSAKEPLQCPHCGTPFDQSGSRVPSGAQHKVQTEERPGSYKPPRL